MIKKAEKIIKENKNLVYFLFFSFILQELLLLFSYSSLYQSSGYKNFSFFSFLIFLSVSLSLNLIYFVILLFLTTITDNFKKFRFMLVFVLETSYSFLLFADIKIYHILGVHISSDSFIESINIRRFKKYLFPGDTSNLVILLKVFLILTIIFIFFGFIYKIAVKIFNFFNLDGFLKITVLLSFLSIYSSLFFYLKQYPVITLIPFYDLFESDINLEWFIPNYPQKIKVIKFVKKPDIVLILSESTRSDMLNSKYMPNVTEFIKKNDCITSKHNFSGAHTTYPSVFSLIFGIYGYNGLFFNNQITHTVPLTLKILKNNGYRTIFLTASEIDASITKNILKDFDIYKNFKYQPNGKSDMDLINYLKKHYKDELKKDDKPVFLVIFLYSTHYAYDFPSDFKKYMPVIDLKDKKLAVDSRYMDKKYKKQLFNRYKNSVLYIDSLFEEIIEFIKPYKNNTVIFYTGDHGEEFWEQGGFGHFKTSFVKQRVQTPFLFCLPGIDSKEMFFTSSIDFFPTLFDYLTNGNFNPIKKYFNGISLLNDKEVSENRFTIISSHPAGKSNTRLCLVNKWGKADIKFNLFKKKSKIFYQNIRDYDDKPVKNEKVKQKIIKDIERFKKILRNFVKLKVQ